MGQVKQIHSSIGSFSNYLPELVAVLKEIKEAVINKLTSKDGQLEAQNRIIAGDDRVPLKIFLISMLTVGIMCFGLFLGGLMYMSESTNTTVNAAVQSASIQIQHELTSRANEVKANTEKKVEEAIEEIKK